jgi:hypothetical protein
MNAKQAMSKFGFATFEVDRSEVWLPGRATPIVIRHRAKARRTKKA